mgnify:CR=1 FL=1
MLAHQIGVIHARCANALKPAAVVVSKALVSEECSSKRISDDDHPKIFYGSHAVVKQEYKEYEFEKQEDVVSMPDCTNNERVLC